MSSFHKPKLYRTQDGCCICKAKSSSSRFTSSVKYEEHFEACFQLTESRKGDICNACVLLVKRFKKLPSGTSRHWSHVVDARAGPGVKNFVRERRRESCRERCFKKKHVYKKRLSPDSSQSDCNKSKPCEDTSTSTGTERKPEPKVSDFIDLSIWKMEKVCCGTIFVGPYREAIIDPRFIERCNLHKGDPNPVMLPKLNNPLFTIEKIIESELKTLTRRQTSSEEAIMNSLGDQKLSREKNSSPAGLNDFYADEGFYDKPSISPTNSID